MQILSSYYTIMINVPNLQGFCHSDELEFAKTRTQIKTTIKNLNRFLVIALFIFRLFYKQLEGLEMGIKQKMDFGLPKFTSIYFCSQIHL